MTETDHRILELEAEVARLRAELEDRDAQERPPGEDPGVSRILRDRSLLANLPDIIAVLDREHRVLYLNRVIPGRRVDEFLGNCVLDFLVENEREARRAALELAWESGLPQAFESRSNSSGIVWENRLLPILENGRVAYMLTTALDVTERRDAENALRDSASMLRHAIDATGMGTWVRDAHGLRWDDSLCRILGVEQRVEPRAENDFVETVHPDDRARCMAMVERARTTGEFSTIEVRIVRPSGEVRHVLVKASVEFDATGAFRRSFGGVFDVTEHHALESRLRIAQKMDAIGHLTAGIAHNFNNVLAVILPTAEICRRSATGSLAARLDAIVHAGERAAEMVRHLMLFARRDTGAHREPISIGDCAERTVAMCRSMFDARIALDVSTAEDLPAVLANAGQIEQVVLNVCLNARDALEDAQTEDPSISVRVERAPNGNCLVRITDNGLGMDEATRAKIFEPFFTTKGVDRGTGLGLATVQAIVDDHGGTIECESALGEGATFVIELPAYHGAVRPTKMPCERAVRGGTETVLVVDDEPLVRVATREVLELAGYRVLEAHDGQTALDTFAHDHTPIAAVILDRSMPGLPGEVVLERLLALAPSLPVLIVSGNLGSESRWTRAAARLAKPVPSDTLLRALRDSLDRANDATSASAASDAIRVVAG